ncbi:MAG: hypothetical protein ACJ75R_09520 [Solirubrobacterales bacterium]
MDPAEARARELLRAVVTAREFEAYERLGFLAAQGSNGRYAYLVYPYRPLVAYDTETKELLSEYCIAFADDGERLPPADDVLAKWMTLRGSERELIAEANHNRPGRQVDPDHARRDIARLEALDLAP